MGFYELGNGCDSCDTIAPINNVNMQSVPSYLSQASMMAPFGTQGSANVSQYVNATTSGYPQSSGMGSMGTGSSGSTMGTTSMGATTMTTTVPTTIVQTIPNVQVQQSAQKMKQIAASSGPAMVMVPASTVEGFSDGSSSGSGSMMHDKKWIVLGLVIFSALASNECCKYFLNKSLQLNDGSPMYYLAYAIVAVLLTFAAYTYISKN